MAQDASRMRMAVINLLVLSLLATLVARLWYIQVLAQPQFRRLAEQTTVRLVYERAPRGFVFDRHGEPLARNRTALTIALDSSRVPDGMEDELLPKLASVLGMQEDDVRERALDPRIGPFSARPIALDVPKDTVVYLLEHHDEFPGVVAEEVPVREYPNGSLAAHVIGHIGEVNAEELQARRGRDPRSAYRPGDVIGKIGVERVYEEYLRGRAGLRKITVNARGEKVEEISNRGDVQPSRGFDAVLTIDASLQRTAEDALQRGVQLARRLTDPDSGARYKAPGGAVAALDPRSGEVLAMASFPAFDPNLFVGPAPRSAIAALNAPEAQFPMLNRAVAEAVPPGSTFKAITAAAAWDAGMLDPNRTFNCPGSLRIGNRTFKDWKPSGHGTTGLRRSLTESCDVVYYTLGTEMNAARPEIGEHLQNVTREFGFGSATGVDLLGERTGLVPDSDWKLRKFSYAQPQDRRWFPGDSANLSVGQGFLLVTPLQLAVAYAAIANGGTVYRPHVVGCVAELDVSQKMTADEACRSGVVPESAAPKVVRRLPVTPAALEFIASAMAGVAVGEGTAAAAFSGFPVGQVPVSGKTGTAQVKPRQDFSWFAAFAPAADPHIVVVAMVEEAGTGAQIAAPIVRRVLEGFFGLPEGNFEAGARAD